MDIIPTLNSVGGVKHPFNQAPNVRFESELDSDNMPSLTTLDFDAIPSALEEQPSVLPSIRAVDNMLEDGEPTMPPQFAGDDGPCVAFHMTKQDFENNLRPIAWVRPSIFYYFYRSFPKYNVGKRFLEFMTPHESETEDCMYFSDWAIEQGRDGMEWQLHKIIKHIRDEEEVLYPGLIKKWKNEPVAVCADPRSSYFTTKAYKLSAHAKNDPLNLVFNIDRSAGALIGFVRLFSSVFVYEGQGRDLALWMSKRSETASYPGLFDLGAGGGVAAGETPLETAFKEAYEEIGLDRSFLEPRMRPAGVSSWLREHKNTPEDRGINREYIYEVQMPRKGESGYTELKSIDGKVESFELMPVGKVLDLLINDPAKLNSLIPLAHFLIRHGIITAENEPHFAEVVARCNRLYDFVASPIWRVDTAHRLSALMILKANAADSEEALTIDLGNN